ncbi:MAG: NAD(P)-binding protein, partial [Bryobacteraceae bacterium]|nr:NAD(P)-binding protein [Bryobacteraceae bacterium]
MAAGEVLIVGAGMSGMVAAINLAREGHRVLVREAEESYGGARIYNPSTHVTPIDPIKTSEYIGIDVSPVFHKVIKCPAFFHQTEIQFPVYSVYGVERGDRPGSLDTLLYGECLNAGVEFEFGRALGREDLDSLPLPDREIFDPANFCEQQHERGTLMASRGCPYSCTYCSNKKMRDIYPNKNCYSRFHSPEYSIEYLKKLLAAYP